MSTLIHNRKAKFDYTFLETYNAGVQLFGSEVKAIRNGDANLVDAFCYFQDGELFVKNLKISSKSKFFEHDPNRDRKLLLTKKELTKLQNSLEKHLTIVPISFYTNERNLIKCEIALCKGKKNYDKRQSIKDNDLKREMREYEKV